MGSKIGLSTQATEQIFKQLAEIQNKNRPEGPKEPLGTSFMQHLSEGVKSVDQQHKVADEMGADLVSGKSGNVHETMIAATQAELSFNLMVQIRNRALEAYNEVMRMQV